MTDIDRAVQALADMPWAVVPGGEADLVPAAALVMRVVRDDLIMAWRNDPLQFSRVEDVENWLNYRIRALTGRPTRTGDTT